MSKRTVLLTALASTPADIRRLLTPVDEETANRRPEPGAWSITEVLKHLIDVEEKYLERLQCVIEENKPFLPYIHPDEAAHPAGGTLAELVGQFEAARHQTLGFLNARPLRDWQRLAVHETWGEVRFRALVQHLVEHDTQHLNQLIDIRQKIQTK